MDLTRDYLASIMDHTMLKAFATVSDIKRVCAEAVAIGAASVCINPLYVPLAREELQHSNVKVCTVIGFPLGANTVNSKADETREAIYNGADEIDMVVNIGAVKADDRDLVFRDIRAVVAEADNALVKVIIEACYLTDAEKIWVCDLAVKAGAGFVKTSTGFGTSGATRQDVELMRSVVPENVGVKAAGGIRTLADAISLLEAGASRLGVSASLSILSELKAPK